MFGMNKSIFRRLILSYMITVIVGIGIVGILMFYFANNYNYNAKQEELLRQSKTVNTNIQATNIIDEEKQNILKFLDHSFDSRIWIFNQEGEIIATSTQDEVSIGKSVASTIVDKVLQGENAVERLSFEGLTEPMLSVVVPWGESDNVYGGIILHSPLTGLNDFTRKMRETILWATLFGIFLSTVMVSYLSWTISRPLHKSIVLLQESVWGIMLNVLISNQRMKLEIWPIQSI